ncbi:MAG: hypothetical protein ABL903_00715, partial [Methylococcales bacterium]
LTPSVFAVLLLGSGLAMAEADYPAADFQPKVLFHDTDSKSSQSSVATEPKAAASETADSNYPAADFQPKVVFQDENASTGSSSAVASGSATSAVIAEDSEHPAANFQPKVLYSDPDYKPGTASIAKSHDSSAVKTQKSEGNTAASDVASTQPEKQGSMDLSLIGIIVLALIAVGFVKFRSAPNASAESPAKNKSGLSGVARYLAAQDKNSVSGVANYLAKQAEARATGVEKYLRKRS